MTKTFEEEPVPAHDQKALARADIRPELRWKKGGEGFYIKFCSVHVGVSNCGAPYLPPNDYNP